MKIIDATFLTACACACAIPGALFSAQAEAAPYQPGPAFYQVDTAKFDWFDQKRNRKIPVKFYFPKDAKGPFPVIVFSHGLGGSRDGYSYLGRHWAEHGYVALYLQHAGSDIDVWQNVAPGEVMEALRQAAAQPTNAAARVLDVTFALDQLEALNKGPGPVRGLLDLERIGMAGHSFGAMTTLAIAGQVFFTPTGVAISAPDPRVKAALAMSSPVPKKKEQWPAAFAKIRIPCLHMTGTEDAMPIGQSSAAERRVPFDRSTQADNYLITFAGGDHMVFVGLTRNAGRAEKDAIIQSLVKNSSLAFWDAFLKGNTAAKAWLADGAFAKEMGAAGTFEKKTRNP